MPAELALALPLMAAGKTLFRAMACDDADSAPVVGDRDLGVRVPTDILVDPGGNVRSGSHGMSVAPDDPTNLPVHRRPRSLGGTGKKPVWAISEDCLNADLRYTSTSMTHGVLAPARTMLHTVYVAALHQTRPDWQFQHA